MPTNKSIDQAIKDLQENLKVFQENGFKYYFHMEKQTTYLFTNMVVPERLCLAELMTQVCKIDISKAAHAIVDGTAQMQAQQK